MMKPGAAKKMDAFFWAIPAQKKNQERGVFLARRNTTAEPVCWREKNSYMAAIASVISVFIPTMILMLATSKVSSES